MFFTTFFMAKKLTNEDMFENFVEQIFKTDGTINNSKQEIKTSPTSDLKQVVEFTNTRDCIAKSDTPKQTMTADIIPPTIEELLLALMQGLKPPHLNSKV